jgi:hypothetical protein
MNYSGRTGLPDTVQQTAAPERADQKAANGAPNTNTKPTTDSLHDTRTIKGIVWFIRM